MTVSVIVPLYKGKKYIDKIFYMMGKNVENLQLRVPFELELILVNDYPDEQIEINLPEMPHITINYFTNDRNRGIHYSKVRGARQAKGEYLLFLDQDDSIEDQYLNSQLQEIQLFDAVFCNGIYRFGEHIFPRGKQFPLKYDTEYYLRNGYPLVSLGQLLIRREAIPNGWMKCCLQNNGWDDHLFWTCMVCEQIKIKYNPQSLYTHEENGNNESFRWEEMQKSGMEFREYLLQEGYFVGEQQQRFSELIDRKLNKYNRYMEIDRIWQFVSRDVLQHFFLKHSIQRIAIYGIGIYGLKLYKALKGGNVRIVYGIDQKAEEKHVGIDVYTHFQDNIKVDAVVCATGFEDEKIIRRFPVDSYTLLQILQEVQEYSGNMGK